MVFDRPQIPWARSRLAIAILAATSGTLIPPAASAVNNPCSAKFAELGPIDPALLKAEYRVSATSLKTRKMADGFLEDDLDDGIRYLKTTEERAHYQVYPHGGKLYDSFGNPVNSVRYNYVMDSQGNLFVNRVGRGEWLPKHSSFLAGEPVAAAGDIDVQDGVVKYIDNASGHYQPPGEFLNQAVQRLRELGIQVPNSAIHDVSHRYPWAN